jgi:hypothetical protein
MKGIGQALGDSYVLVAPLIHLISLMFHRFFVLTLHEFHIISQFCVFRICFVMFSIPVFVSVCSVLMCRCLTKGLASSPMPAKAVYRMNIFLIPKA